jgi:predicted DNA-binding transcriptional regulator AlpA
MTKRELLASTAAVQPVEPQRTASKNKTVQTVKLPPPRDNSRAKRANRHASAAKRSGDDGGNNGDGDGDSGDGDGDDGGSGGGDDGDAPPRPGAGYKLGPRPAKRVPADAIWLTSNQVCARYGAKSQMWLWRKIKRDPDFPKPVYFGRMMMFLVAELDAYDHGLISKRVGAER